MRKFKKQFDDILIPESPYKRSLQGIKQAEKEQRKPQNWLPKVVVMIVTVAVSFIALSVTEKDTFQQQASTFIEKSSFSPQFYWFIAIVLMLATVYTILRAIHKGMNKKLGIASGVILILMLGNSAVFLQNQLAKPVIVPLVQDFPAGNETHDLEVRYITNKNDHRSVSHLQVGELTLFAKYYDNAQNEDLFYYPTDTSAEGRYQLMRSAYFQGDTETMQALINSDEVFLVLDDGEKLPTKLQLNFERSENTVSSEFLSSSGGSDGEQTMTVTMRQDAVFDEVFIPQVLKESVRFEAIQVNQQTFTDVDFPITVEEGEQVTLTFYSKDMSIDMQAIVGVDGPNGLLPHWILGRAELNVQKIREESERHDGA